MLNVSPEVDVTVGVYANRVAVTPDTYGRSSPGTIWRELSTELSAAGVSAAWLA
jgi:hypothetical protein